MLRNTVLLGVSLLMACGLCELGLRLLKPQFTYSRLLELAGSHYAPSDYNTFQLKANYHGHEPSMEHPGRYVSITTNADGLRGRRELDPSKQKVLVLGDSYTFGVYVDDDETYPAILNQLIGQASTRYQVVNAGYADGWDSDQQYVWLKRNIRRLRPDIVVLGVFLGNDITGIETDAWVDVDGDGLPDKWISKDLYVANAGYIVNRLKGLATVGVESIYRLPGLRESHLAIVAGKAWDRIEDWLEQRHPEPIGESFDHIFGHYTDDFLQKEAIFLKLLQAMNKLSKDNGSAFMVALLPMNVMVEKEKFDLSATYGTSVLPARYRNAAPVYYARLAKLLQQMDIPAIDIESAMKRSTIRPFFPANGEVHFNPNGHSFTAERLFDYLRAHHLID